MNALSVLLITSGLTVAAPPAEERPLNIGDPAPALKVAKWLKGKPITEFEGGKVYVLEFWATWCGPCKRLIPHITELAAKYRDKATFIGVNVFEDAEMKEAEVLSNVAKFVEAMGERMGYPVAAEGAAGYMGKNWVEAAGEDSIPATFIVGGDGKIAWIGHPEDLDETLDAIIKGKFDTRAEADKRMKEKLEGFRENRLLARIAAPMQKGKPGEALAELQKVEADYPQYKDRGQFAFLRYGLLLQTDEARAYRYARDLAKGDFGKQPGALYKLIRPILDNPALKTPDYRVAITLAKKANELTEEKHPLLMATQAQAHFKNKEPQKAADMMEKAVALASRAQDFPPELQKLFRSQLAEFRKAARE